MAQVSSGSGRRVVAVPLAISTTVTEAIRVPSGQRLVAVQFPASLDATAMNFLASYDGTTFVEVEDPSGIEVTVVVAASKFVMMPDLSGIPFLKLEFGTTQDPTITLQCIFESAGPSPYWHSAAILAAS